MKVKGKINNHFFRNGLLVVGFCATGLAILGIFLPLVPTVPLLLLAAACFARSSERFHNWLLNHRKLGPMIHVYLNGQGIPLRAKITAIGLIWLSISISVFVVQPFWLKFLLVIIGFSVTLYLLSLTTSQDV
ncbi:MAG: YbaN family protein [Deltaproteobacteria bacterium]|jgi:uncharacterized membrane protein YbaN (DUF454 family)|nr:YbaN family protein [Deltaproteobacteria bacterium]